MKFVKTFGECSGPLDFPMSTENARALEKQLDSGEWAPIRIQKSDAFESVLDGERSDISVISDGAIDRHGEIIDPNTISFKKFQGNPIVAWNHNYQIPPIGKSLWQRLCSGNIWKAKTQYASRPTDLPSEQAWFPDAIFHLVKVGALNAKSIGGVVQWRGITKEDIDKNPSYTTAQRISKHVEVYEYSATPIGANSGTIVEQVSKGLISMPDDIIQKAFSQEIVDALRELKIKPKEDSFPVIKSYRTFEDHKRREQQLFEENVTKLRENIPKLVEDSFNRFLGRVS